MNCPNSRGSSHCGDNDFDCGDQITCIHQSWVCDHAKDCPNEADEEPHRCQNATCRADQFQCADHTCISGDKNAINFFVVRVSYLLVY